MEGGGAAGGAGPDMGMIASMQPVGSSPTQRPLGLMNNSPGLMPSIDRQGWAGNTVWGGQMFGQGGLSEFRFGFLGGGFKLFEELKACYVPMGELFKMEGTPIQGAEIQGAEIRGDDIRGADIAPASGAGNSILSEASNIEAPKISAAEIRAATSISAPSVS